MSQKKQIFKLSILKKLLADENSCVSLVPSTRLLGLPPFFLTDMKSGILYLLNSMLKKYDRSLGGIVIGYQNIKVLMDENTGIIPIGTSEMEVNISVEFYIFQPKIGSYLEGVVNKKSSNHIGCLVHQYFNATILKSEDVLYEDWICKDLNVDDKIVFKVKDLDFTTLLPYIEGIYDGKLSLDKVESKSSGNCDINNMIASDMNKDSQEKIFGELLNGRSNSGEICDSLDGKKAKNEIQCKDEIDGVNTTSTLEENQSFTDMNIKQKKKKKKKEKEKVTTDDNVMDKAKNSNDKDSILVRINNELQEDESLGNKKKKKKKRKENDNNDEQQFETESVEKERNSALLPSQIQEKLFLVDENSNDFVKTSKKKKEKKKNRSEESISSFNKTNECLPSQEVENSMLYSTQLDPVLGSKKMRMSFCSPIPRSTPFEDKVDDKNATSSLLVNNRDNATEKEKKKKHKKREREKQEESMDTPFPKKIKLSNTEEPQKEKKEETKREVNGTDRKSIVQIMMEQMYQEQLKRVREELRMSLSDRESLKEEKRKKKEAKKRKREKEQDNSIDLNENSKSQLYGGDRKSELQNTFSELCRQELQRVKEEFSMSENESFRKSRKKAKKRERELSKEKTIEDSPKMKERKNAQINCTNDEKSDLRSTVDELYRQEIDRMKKELSRSHTESVKEEKKKKKKRKKEEKKKSMTSDSGTSREGTHDSLYAKLLNQAKNAIDLEKIAAPVPPPIVDWGRKKKDSELSDMSTTSSSNRKDSKKKNKEKLKDCLLPPPTKYKNGSMYDIGATPEKINPDKSLFSDSEQSHSSPVKKKKGINGFEIESGKSKVQNMLEEFYREEMKRLKNESDKDSQKSSEKKSKKRKKAEEEPQISIGKESLYEKLLKEARNLVDVRELSSTVKKEKNSKKSKNGEGLC